MHVCVCKQLSALPKHKWEDVRLPAVAGIIYIYIYIPSTSGRRSGCRPLPVTPRIARYFGFMVNPNLTLEGAL